MSVIVIRIELDELDIVGLSELVAARHVTIGDATEAKCIREMNDLQRLMWVRQVKLMIQSMQRAS